ncbi:MAG: beta-propeller domain-containing protein [Firmicutes bacterium]|nr:beta-propeller domain-containing protein [Bacillota bacterium]
MNNKVLLNFAIIYFLILCVVLFFQIRKENSLKEKQNNNPRIVTEDRLDNAVVLCKESPILLVNERQVLIDSEDVSLVPQLKGEAMYVPAKFFETAYGAMVSYENDNKLYIRMDNKALELGSDGSAHISESNKEKNINSNYTIYKASATTYVPLSVFAEGFGKYTYYYDGLVIMADKNNLFSRQEDSAFIEDLRKDITGLPKVANEEKLIQLISENNGNENKDTNSLSSDKKVALVCNDKLYYAASSMLYTFGEEDTSLELEKGFVPKAMYNLGERLALVGEITADSCIEYGKKNKDILNPTTESTTFAEAATETQSLESDIENTSLLQTTEETTEQTTYEFSGRFLSEPLSFDTKQTVLYIFDITKDPYLVRSTRISGGYYDSSFEGNYVYLLSNEKAEHYSQQGSFRAPAYMDSAEYNKKKESLLVNMEYFPELYSADITYTMAVSINNEAISVKEKAFFGAGEYKYLSGSEFFVSKHINCAIDDNNKNEHTHIYKLTLNPDSDIKLSRGFVRGYIPYKTAMDEDKGYFRIITDYKEGEKNVNSIYVLNNNLEISGKATRIASGTDTKSAVFTENMAYLIPKDHKGTVHMVDLTNPLMPQGCGGYNFNSANILIYPYDANRILVLDEKNTDLEMSIYNLANKKDIKKEFTQVINNAHTPLFENTNMFSFDRDKNIFVLPLKLNTTPHYEGGYVYEINMTEGFKKIGEYPDLSMYDEAITQTVSTKNNVYVFADNVCSVLDINAPSEVKVWVLGKNSKK